MRSIQHRSLPRIMALACLLMLFAASHVSYAAALPLADKVMIIDPGHGGDDAGVDPAGSGLIEKDVALDLGQRLQRQLAAQGATVLLTRSSDRFVARQARVQFTNAVLFRPDNSADHGRLVSIHINSSRSAPTLRRVEVLVDPQADGPFTLAADLADRLREATGGGIGYVDQGYPEGVHPADIATVRWTYPRGANVLSESAYLSNPEQARQLRDPMFLEAIAQAHADALLSELGR